jgi:uncharacterized membrane protein
MLADAGRAAEREMALKVAQFVNIMLLVLIAGALWGTWFTLGPSLASFTPEIYLTLGKAIIQNLRPIMPILMPTAIVSTLPVLYLLPQKKSSAFYLTLTGFVLLLVTALITVAIEVPIDNQVREWTLTSLPSNWEALRDRWAFYHTLRTFTALGGLGLVLAGTLSSSPSKQQPL